MYDFSNKCNPPKETNNTKLIKNNYDDYIMQIFPFYFKIQDTGCLTV